jgi:hypothetical protein
MRPVRFRKRARASLRRRVDAARRRDRPGSSGPRNQRAPRGTEGKLEHPRVGRELVCAREVMPPPQVVRTSDPEEPSSYSSAGDPRRLAYANDVHDAKATTVMEGVAMRRRMLFLQYGFGGARMREPAAFVEFRRLGRSIRAQFRGSGDGHRRSLRRGHRDERRSVSFTTLPLRFRLAKPRRMEDDGPEYPYDAPRPITSPAQERAHAARTSGAGSTRVGLTIESTTTVGGIETSLRSPVKHPATSVVRPRPAATAPPRHSAISSLATPQAATSSLCRHERASRDLLKARQQALPRAVRIALVHASGERTTDDRVKRYRAGCVLSDGGGAVPARSGGARATSFAASGDFPTKCFPRERPET